jgi:hypothetical protein
MKTKWSLDNLIPDGSSLNDSWSEDANLRSVVRQVMGYLCLNKLQYGALSSFDNTWFLKREGHNILWISQPVHYLSSTPFLYRCICYMASLCSENSFWLECDLSSSVDTGYVYENEEEEEEEHEEGDDGNDESSSNTSTGTREPAQKKLKTTSQTSGKTAKASQDTIPKDFHLGLLRERIGFGVCGVVHRSSYRGIELAVKMCDVFNNKKGVELMKKEVEVYKLLSSLQGSSIPRLHFYGQRWGLYIIATSYISGAHPKMSGISEEVLKKQLDERTNDFLSLGISHGDIRDENMIVTPDGKLILLDFSHSSFVNNAK